MPDSFETILENIVRRVVREEIRAALADKPRERPKDWLTAAECAAIYGTDKTFKKSWFEARGRSGEIATSKPGRFVLFSRRSVEEYLQKHVKKLT